MAGMKEVIELQAVVFADDAFQTPSTMSRAIFADKKPLFGVEFHAATASGIELAHIMQVRAIEYQGERFARYKGQDYEIYRTYERNDDWIELYLSSRRHP